MLRSKLILSGFWRNPGGSYNFKETGSCYERVHRKTRSIKIWRCEVGRVIPKKIVDSVSELLRDEKKYNSMILKANPYGNGKASEKILTFLKKYF